MKKYLSVLFIMFTLLSVVAFAQEKPDDVKTNDVTAGQVYNDVKDAGVTIYQDVKSALQGLSGPLKVGAEHVYTVLVKQQVVEAITWLIIDSVALISTTIFLILAFRFAMKDENKGGDNTWLIVPVLLFLISLGTTVATINYIVAGFVNPEYGAIKEILNFIKR